MRGLQTAIILFFTCNRNRRSYPSLVNAFLAPRVSTAKIPLQQQQTDDINEDWRDFRARLVQQEGGRGSAGGADKADRSTNEWAYESNLIERGSVILSRPQPAFGGGLLRVSGCIIARTSLLW